MQIKYGLIVAALCLCLLGCAAHKTVKIVSDPSGLRVNKGGAVVCTTPCELQIGAGDALFCTPSYWSFWLVVDPPSPGQIGKRRLVDACGIPDGATVYFDMRDPAGGGSQSGGKKEVRAEMSIGTGWPVTENCIVTASHVIQGRKSISLVLSSGAKLPARILVEDRVNDLVLLTVEAKSQLPPPLSIADSPARTGMKVFTVGFPHPDIMGTAPKLTAGEIGAESGFRDDPRFYQISVPVQAGNSGGPLLNDKGEVVGVVIAKLDALKMLRLTGDFPEGVNYALKSDYLRPLLRNVSGVLAVSGPDSKPVEELHVLAGKVSRSVVMIVAE